MIIYDLLGDCPELTNGGLHSMLFREAGDDAGRLLRGICQYCGKEGTFTRIEYDSFIATRDMRRAAARRRREPKSGRR